MMNTKTNPKQTNPFERLQGQVIHSRGLALEVLLDSLTSDAPVTFEQIRFDGKSMSMRLRWPFEFSRALGDSGEYLGTVNSQIEFRKGLRRHFKGRDAGRHLASALYRELRAFTILFTKAHRWGETVLAGLNAVGERRMARRHGRVEIGKLTEICDRVKSWKSRDADLRRRVLKRYSRELHPWVGSLFPALRDLHGRPSIKKLDRPAIRRLVVAIIQRER